MTLKRTSRLKIHVSNLQLNRTFTYKEKLRHRGWYYKALRRRHKGA